MYPMLRPLSLSSFPIGKNSTPRMRAQRKEHFFSFLCLFADNPNTGRTITTSNQGLSFQGSSLSKQGPYVALQAPVKARGRFDIIISLNQWVKYLCNIITDLKALQNHVVPTLISLIPKKKARAQLIMIIPIWNFQIHLYRFFSVEPLSILQS